MTPEKIISMIQDRGVADFIAFYAKERHLWTQVLDSIGAIDEDLEEALKDLMDAHDNFCRAKRNWREIAPRALGFL